MKIILAGSSGLIGTALIHHLTSNGHEVQTLTRSDKGRRDRSILWKPEDGVLPADALEGADAVVHLGGETILGRWTSAKKKRIEESRIKSTHLIATTLAGLSSPPKVFLCASAIGAYGSSKTEVFTEDSPFGAGFLPAVCKSWEEACTPAIDGGIRTAHLRFGVVLSTQGGALRQMLPAFRAGLGGPLGDGSQMMSWISVEDVILAIDFLIHNESINGPVNLVSPHPVTNREFSKTLALVLSRPCFLSIPGFVISLLFGEMGRTLLLEGQAVKPEVLLEAGYEFKHPELEGGLRELIG